MYISVFGFYAYTYAYTYTSHIHIYTHRHMKGMFKTFNIALVMAEDQHFTNEISKELEDPAVGEGVCGGGMDVNACMQA